jgi:hypothetical protein
MSPDQQFAIAFIGAFTALIGAMATLFIQLRQLHAQVNSRLDQLVELTRTAAHAEGKLEGQNLPNPMRRSTD